NAGFINQGTLTFSSLTINKTAVAPPGQIENDGVLTISNALTVNDVYFNNFGTITLPTSFNVYFNGGGTLSGTLITPTNATAGFNFSSSAGKICALSDATLQRSGF